MTEKKFRCNEFCRDKDLYANPINLTFNKEKVYKTPYGGVLTFLSGLVIFIWVLLQVVAVLELSFTQTWT
jgi:hypothetical protein